MHSTLSRNLNNFDNPGDHSEKCSNSNGDAVKEPPPQIAAHLEEQQSSSDEDTDSYRRRKARRRAYLHGLGQHEYSRSMLAYIDNLFMSFSLLRLTN